MFLYVFKKIAPEQPQVIIINKYEKMRRQLWYKALASFTSFNILNENTSHILLLCFE